MVCRVGVRGVGKELEDEVDDGGLGMAERVGVLGFKVRSIFFGEAGVFRIWEDRARGDGLAGGDGEVSAEILVTSALWGSGLIGRAAFPCDAEDLDLSPEGTPSASPFSSSVLLARLRVPK